MASHSRCQAGLLQRAFYASLTQHALDTCWGIPATVTGVAVGAEGLWGTFLFSSAGRVRGKCKSVLFWPGCQLPDSSPASWKWPVLTLEGRNHTFSSCLYSRWRGQNVAKDMSLYTFTFYFLGLSFCICNKMAEHLPLYLLQWVLVSPRSSPHPSPWLTGLTAPGWLLEQVQFLCSSPCSFASLPELLMLGVLQIHLWPLCLLEWWDTCPWLTSRCILLSWGQVATWA